MRWSQRAFLLDARSLFPRAWERLARHTRGHNAIYNALAAYMYISSRQYVSTAATTFRYVGRFGIVISTSKHTLAALVAAGPAMRLTPGSREDNTYRHPAVQERRTHRFPSESASLALPLTAPTLPPAVALPVPVPCLCG